MGVPMKRILLIQCGPDARYESFRKLSFEPEQGIFTQAAVVPLPCATLAALTPDHYHVDLWDENLQGQIGPDTPLGVYDIAGISLMFSYLTPQARYLALLFRLRGALVVGGGPGISAAPEDFRDCFDVLLLNEAERTWPRFLQEYERGQHQREYRQIEKPSLAESPPPDWRPLARRIPEYEWGAVQTTRGCPFDCEFCDVIYLFGRRQRHKPVEQVLREVQALEALGTRGIFFTDDEFVGDKQYAKELLAALIPLNNSLRRPLRYYTQLTLNLSKDDELLELVADANFYTSLVGIESFNKDSLREAHKHHNAARDIMTDIHKIQSHGLGLLGTFIVGFDHDGPGVFEELYEGIQRACLPWVVIGTLHVFHNTRLWVRLKAEGRVSSLYQGPEQEPVRLDLNYIPKGMSRVELLEGYRELCERVHSWEAFNTRLRGWLAGVRRLPRVVEPPFTRAMGERLVADMGRGWQLSPRELGDLGDTLEHTRRVAPELLHRVVFFILQNEWVRRTREELFSGFEELLARERAGRLVADARPVHFPPELGAALAPLLPELYSQLYRSLPDEQLVPEAMKEVLVDFIVRWGAGLRELEPQHRHFLLELGERTAARLGGPPAGAPREDAAARLAQARRSRLFDSVLKDVRDELARLTAP